MPRPAPQARASITDDRSLRVDCSSASAFDRVEKRAGLTIP